jgi:hypothetical protein
MPSAELTNTQTWHEPVAGATAPCLSSPRITAGSQPMAGHGLAVFHAIARVRRALADSARAWALAAGVPPDLYP